MDTKEKRMKLKSIFKGYKRMTPKIERGLKQMGINVVRQRKHVILNIPNGNESGVMVLSTTGGDDRTGLNIVSTIMNELAQRDCQ